MRVVETVEELKGLIGQELGVGEWYTVTQETIDKFADVTGDHQWIHVDVERARKEVPGGKTIAHGYLVLSLLPLLSKGTYRLAWPSRTFNYGSDKVRFITPTPAGGRLRLKQTLISVEDAGKGSHRIVVRSTLELEGAERPALIADTIRMTFS